MLYTAIRLQGTDLAQMARWINQGTLQVQLADVTPHSLKERVRLRIALHRDEKWLIIAGQVTAQWSANAQGVIFT